MLGNYRVASRAVLSSIDLVYQLDDDHLVTEQGEYLLFVSPELNTVTPGTNVVYDMLSLTNSGIHLCI
jgi:hypothetical protein